jgi:hypothetical protein
LVKKLGGKKETEAAPKKDADVLGMLAKKRRPGEKCGVCGHWSSATEYGVDEKSGYCDRWEKLTDREFWCEDFISQQRFKQMQSQLAEENEDYIDEDT